MPIVIHGDASFPAQGVVAETLNLQALDGYKVGGTVHIITNNQVGFTTDPDDARSTRWASDLAKGFDVPIIHVNADDVQACMSAVRLAFAFRQEFGHDVLIDLIGYRRFGHNESDEPAYTQPEMYAKIKSKKRVSELWADRLVAEGVVSQEEVDAPGAGGVGQPDAAAPAPEGEDRGRGGGARRAPRPASTSSTARRARRSRRPCRPSACASSASSCCACPRASPCTRSSSNSSSAGARRWATERADVDWAHAEALAFASLLTEGTPIRLTGQDTERGTFSQRHMVLHDAKTGQTVCPIQSLPDALAPLELHNSPLSELACMGFEYGYSQEAPETLVLWEAQFGDFVNSAQVIVDQFIVSGLAKWGQTSRLTLLLPHGYEGSGPEHSSARLERFLRARRRGQHPRGEPDDAGPVLPPAAPPGADRQAAPARGDDAEVAAAPAAGDEHDRRHGRGHALSPGARRAGRRRRAGHAPACCARARSTTTSSATPTAPRTRASRSRASSCSTPSPKARSSS